jgi:hypothetical protein
MRSRVRQAASVLKAKHWIVKIGQSLRFGIGGILATFGHPACTNPQSKGVSMGQP